MYQVSASIVLYKNDTREVVAAIRSLFSAPVRAFLTVVDNSPTAVLRQCVIESGANYIFAGKNLGFGGGHNLALQAARGLADFHLIQNPDVTYPPESLADLYNFMCENNDVGLVMPQIRYPDGTEQRLCKRLPTPFDLCARRFLGPIGRTMFKNRMDSYELRDLDMSVAREIPSLSGCFMFVRSSALDKVGFFDERFFMYMEDVDLCRRIGREFKTVFYPHVSVTHGYAKGSYRDYGLLKQHAVSAIRYFSKWGWFADAEAKRMNRKLAPVANCQVPGSSHITRDPAVSKAK
jgi:GT2 family glycosyltransferase